MCVWYSALLVQRVGCWQGYMRDSPSSAYKLNLASSYDALLLLIFWETKNAMPEENSNIICCSRMNLPKQ